MREKVYVYSYMMDSYSAKATIIETDTDHNFSKVVAHITNHSSVDNSPTEKLRIQTLAKQMVKELNYRSV